MPASTSLLKHFDTYSNQAKVVVFLKWLILSTTAPQTRKMNTRSSNSTEEPVPQVLSHSSSSQVHEKMVVLNMKYNPTPTDLQ